MIEMDAGDGEEARGRRDSPRPVAIGALVAGACAVAFVALALQVGERTQGIDAAVLTWFAEHRTAGWTKFFLAMTALGSGALLAVLTVGVCVAAWLSRQRRLAVALACAMLGARQLSETLKSVYARGRPSVVSHLEDVGSMSFPSGHTIGSVVFCATLVLLVYEHTRGRALRCFLIGYSVSIGAVVACSRMYLGVHYPTDVLGGALVGITWSLVVVTVERLWARRARA